MNRQPFTAKPKTPAALILIGVLAVALLGLAVVGAMAWMWQTFSTTAPWLALAIEAVLFGSVAAAPVVGLLIAWRRWADRQFIQAHHVTQLTLASRSQGLPERISSLNYHITAQPPARIDAAQIAGQAPQLPPPDVTPPSLIDAIGRGLSTPEQWLIGVAQDGTPQTIPLKHTGFIALGGIPGTGKTNAAAWLAAQCAAHNGTIFVADPQAGDQQSLAARLAPLAGAIREIAKTPDEINAMIAHIGQIYQRRNSSSADFIGKPLLVVIDEFMGMMLRRELTGDSLAVLIALAGEGRKKYMFAVPASQNWNMRAVGSYGVAIRQLTTAALVFKSKKETAETLLPLAYAQQALTLKPGQTLFFGADEPVMTAIPLVSDADMAYAARGRVNTPPQPASPASVALVQPPATPAMPPTVRVPVTPAPPTVALSNTIPDQILLLLDGAGRYMTASEIAATLQMDLQTIRVIVGKMFKAGQLSRREIQARTTTEWYEYTRYINKRPSGPLAVSA